MIRPLVRRALRELVDLYYLEIRVVGAENLPRCGPAILVANHPNSIMDPLLLSTRVAVPLSFLARSGLFANPIIGAVLRWMGAIPVYRRQDGPIAQGSNDAAFAAAYQVLGDGGVIGVFPEGQNAPERHLGEVKTGAARIALGAVSANHVKHVSIIPVGLNYEDRDRYLTRVLVRVGEPIVVDASLTKSSNAVDVTNQVRAGIESQVTHLHDVRYTDVLHDVADFLRAEGIALIDAASDDRSLIDPTIAKKGIESHFAQYDAIASALNHYARHDPEVVAQVARQLARYKQNVEQLQLKYDFVRRTPHAMSRLSELLKFSVTALSLYPITFFAAVQHMPAFIITRWFALRAPDDAMRAVRALGCAAILFPLTYLALGYLLLTLGASSLGTLAYLSVLPIAALGWLKIRTRMEQLVARFLLRDLFVERRKRYRQLLLEREALLARLEGLQRALTSSPESTPPATAASGNDN